MGGVGKRTRNWASYLRTHNWEMEMRNTTLYVKIGTVDALDTNDLNTDGRKYLTAQILCGNLPIIAKHATTGKKGMHIELDNDLALKTEIGYGRIKIVRHPNIDNVLTIYIICLQCDYGKITKGGIKSHLPSKNEPKLHYNPKFPYCPKNYRDLGSINRHLYQLNDIFV